MRPGALAVVALLLVPAGATAAEAPVLRAGAVELGLEGSLVAVEGTTTAAVAVRGGRFFGAGSGLGGLEVELGYDHVRDLDTVELGGNVSWQRPVGATYPYLALGGGLRQENLGSFNSSLYPVGFAVGVRALFGERAAMRVEYCYRRVLDDPVADFSEHQARIGISLLLHNGTQAADVAKTP